MVGRFLKILYTFAKHKYKPQIQPFSYMQKLLLFTLMLLLVPLHATAQDNLEQKLIVTMKDGTKAEFNLNSEPSIYTSIIDMTLNIEWNGEDGVPTKVVYDLLQVENFTFDNSSTAVDGIQLTNGKLKGDFFVVPTGKANISIATIDGRILSVNSRNVGDNTMIDLRQLPKGIYIINHNGNSFKLQRP